MKLYRVAYVFISYLLLWKLPSTGQAFFTTILIFVAGLTYDYYSIYIVGREKNIRYQKIIGQIGRILGFIFMIFGLLGLMCIIELIKDETIGYMIQFSNTMIIPNTLKNCTIHLNYILLMMLIFPAIATLEPSNELIRPNDIPFQPLDKSA